MSKRKASIKELQSAINRYYSKWRNPDQASITLSLPNDLDKDWSLGSSWPNCDKAGIYAILDKDQKLLYVGKASMSNSIAGRLSSYFRYGPDRRCITMPGHDWRCQVPAFVVSAAVVKPWEAPSLEEYLIDKLQPISNSAGRKVDAEEIG